MVPLTTKCKADIICTRSTYLGDIDRSARAAFLNFTLVTFVESFFSSKARVSAGFSIHFIATGLLQLTVVSSAKVNHSAPAACDECSGSRRHERVVARPRETSSEAVTLAAG